MRISNCFQTLAHQKRGGLVAYSVAGDPSLATSLQVLRALAQAGVDVLEVGMPFSDPLVDGPIIQAATKRALSAGTTLHKVLKLVAALRTEFARIPIVLMGYYNPIHAMGQETFVKAASSCGADALLIVDLPPEENAQLRPLACAHGLMWIQLVTPTTHARRLPQVLEHAAGFLYYVAITGTTGAHSGREEAVRSKIRLLRAASNLPIVTGFGLRSPAQAARMARIADAAVVGSAFVEAIGVDAKMGRSPVERVSSLARRFVGAVRTRAETE